jgi:hypothetical protein
MGNEKKLDVFKSKFWKPVQKTLDKLITKSPDEVKSWFLTETFSSAYAQVYMCCTAPAIAPSPYESEISANFFTRKLTYECLKVYMTEHFQEVSLGIESQITLQETFNCYIQAHLDFEAYRKLIKMTFNCVQHQWIDVVNNGSFSFRREILSIEKLLVSLWLQFVIQPSLSRILKGAKTELKNIRKLKLHESRVADFISFIFSYSQDQELPQCAIICESLVQFCEEDLEMFLGAFASTNSSNSKLDVSKCELIFNIWNEEMERVNAVFGKVQDLVEKYKNILRERLFEPSGRLIEEVIIDSLRNPQINQSLISGAYKTYSAYNVLHPRLVYLFERILMGRVASKPVNDMSHILECTIWADSLLRDCFEENTVYTLILEKVLRPVFRGNSSYTLMLAEQIDKVIRTENALIKNSSEHRQLCALMAQLRFVEDKETLRANYAHFLALRLMTWRQQASDVLIERIKMEKRVVDSLRKTCGSDFVEQLSRMLADVEKEKENSKELLSADMSSEVQVMILAASWPQAKNGWKESIWPKQLQKAYSVAASNYKERFSGRKLEWLPELSTVAVKMGNSLVSLSVVQYSFLELLLQKGSHAPIADCLAHFDLTEEALASLIYGFTACGLVQTANNDYFINEKALDKFPPRVDLALAVRNRIPQQRQPAPSESGALNQPIDYDDLVQCHLVRISKREGKKGRLLKTLLLQKTKDAISSRITLTDYQLEAQLKILIDKGYIEIDAMGKYIKYCP